jgi:multiple sugar transport system substrate-binding protein
MLRCVHIQRKSFKGQTMRKWNRRSRATAAGSLAAVMAAGLLAGCSTGNNASHPNQITIWSEENSDPQIADTNKIIGQFEKESGVKVKLVGIAENQLPQLIMSAAAAGTLPDVIGGLPIGQVWQMYSNGLLNTKVSSQIVNSLGTSTFDKNALELTSDKAQNLAVPSDAWLQLLVYRKDLLAKAGLPAPDTYAKLENAAKTLNTGGQEGISVATDPSDVFTQQSFESIALANGCQLVNSSGQITLDSPACKATYRLYDKLGKTYGVTGTQTVDSTRATYFAGKTGMVLWSTFLLDELAGLRSDALPNCPQCVHDKNFLSSRSGVVTELSGPDNNKPAPLGEVASWAVTKTANAGAAQKWVEYVMTKGYENWFGMSPEGQLPVRHGTATDPQEYVNAWRHSEIGVDGRKPLDKAYPSALLDQLVSGVNHMQRWGFKEGEGALVGATQGQLPIPKAISSMTNGQTDPDQAAKQSDQDVSALQKSLQ